MILLQYKNIFAFALLLTNFPLYAEKKNDGVDCKDCKDEKSEKTINAVTGSPEAAKPKIKKEPPKDKNDVIPEAKVSSIRKFKPFNNIYEELAFFERIRNEHEAYGQPKSVVRYKKNEYGQSLVEQRSGRKRLYDHNIFLRAIFSEQLEVSTTGNLYQQFEKCLFFDIGSAILSEEGAVTVRDIYEDKKIANNLVIVASDVNDISNKKTRYIEIYRKKTKKLPFPVVEIAMTMQTQTDFLKPIEKFLNDDLDGVILRSANSGPDLYYTKKHVIKHLTAAGLAFFDKNLIYFFNKFILYKPESGEHFVILGEIDASVGTNHRKATWEDVDWDTRTFHEAIKINPFHLRYREEN